MGLFKSNITAAVGSLYPTEVERDLSLSRLYWAVNLGALPAGVVGGWLAKHYGYSAAFLSAAGACLSAWCLWMFSGRTLFSEHSTTAHVTQSHASEKDRLATVSYTHLDVYKRQCSLTRGCSSRPKRLIRWPSWMLCWFWRPLLWAALLAVRASSSPSCAPDSEPMRSNQVTNSPRSSKSPATTH